MKPRHLIFLTLLISTSLMTSGCALFNRDRCFISDDRYFDMRTIYQQTGSYQRTAQTMNDQGWARCEINQFRYRLRQDLGLVSDDFGPFNPAEEPDRRKLGLYPGIVR